MISIKDRIESAYDSVDPDNMVFTDKRWNIRTKLMAWLFAIVGISGILIPQYINFKLGSMLALFWFMFGTLGFYIWVNSHAKTRLRLLPTPITPSKGLLTSWINPAYREYKLAKFYEKLCETNLLSQTVSDIEMTKKFQMLFNKESNHFFKKGDIIIGSVIAFFLTFSMPVWSQYVGVLFEKNKDKSVEVLLLCLTTITLISVIASAFAFFKWVWNDYENKQSNKYRDIARLIEMVHFSLEHKYATVNNKTKN